MHLLRHEMFGNNIVASGCCLPGHPKERSKPTTATVINCGSIPRL
jgi:hypothetical protein